tara:strand:- start:42 stop:179 length:138 start_codon:yes stop_codon:yes gene_type:complete
MPNKPEKVFGAGIGNFKKAKTPPKDKPEIKDRIEYFIGISFFLIN